MHDHRKKMIAPIIVTALFLAYLLLYGVLAAAATEHSVWTFLFAIPLIALGIGMIYVLYARIKEIRRGEEDDLSNY